jgi:hypothetical protein
MEGVRGIGRPKGCGRNEDEEAGLALTPSRIYIQASSTSWPRATRTGEVGQLRRGKDAACLLCKTQRPGPLT